MVRFKRTENGEGPELATAEWQKELVRIKRVLKLRNFNVKTV